jgi:ADP-dependent NAD(P)H-hydrate dehydratase / NAD(P)H-hydrate epimerase
MHHQPHPIAPDQVLTAAQMLHAEHRLMDAGTDVHALMQRAGRGAAEWVWRIASGTPVTVLCGPGNNGGDGYVIAQALHDRGFPVQIVAALPPATEAARRAASLYRGAIVDAAEATGAVLVDCLFGSGLNREVTGMLRDMLHDLAARHGKRIAIDLPSGVATDSGAMLIDALPHYDLCIALGAWKPAHFLMPAMQHWRAARLVDIGCGQERGAAHLIGRPAIHAPAADAHKYTRGLIAVVGGAMEGAAMLASRSAALGGAGYVKMLAQDSVFSAPADLVVMRSPGMMTLPQALSDDRIAAVLCGPGLGRDHQARERMEAALESGHPAVLDADALVLLRLANVAGRTAPLVLTPHEGELARLEQAFGLPEEGGKQARALALAKATNAVVIAKGADTLVASPDGALAYAPRASSWLSVAGTGDVLAGLVAARLAVTGDAFRAAQQAVWLHKEAARQAGAGFTAAILAESVRDAMGAAL